MDKTPWKESATLSRRSTGEDSGDTAILLEGTLREAAERAGHTPLGQRRELRIALPDRHVAPFRFEGVDLEMLIDRERAISRAEKL